MERRIYFLFTCLFFLVICFTLKINNVQAKEVLTLGRAENVYYTRRGGGKPYTSDFYPLYDMGGKTAYCIEPGVQLAFFEYNGTLGMIDSPYGAETNRLLQLIGHYGYEYPGHNTLRYRMATQALIWEIAGGQIVEFYTERYGYGNEIDVSYEREEIMRLVNAHDLKPDFSGTSFKGYVGKTIILEDKNNVLEAFTFSKNDAVSIQKNGNKLYITPTKVGKTTITLTRAKYDSVATMIFTAISGISQKLAILRASDDVNMQINLTVDGGKVTVQKLDKDTTKNLPQGQGSLKGAIYGVYDQTNKLITKLTTDEKGIAMSEILPSFGKYYLKELSPSLGYELDSNVYNFEITETNLNPKITVYEKVIESKVDIYKVLGEENTKELKGEANISFDIYLKGSNSVYKTIKTDSTGHAKFNLPYGTYVFKQKNTTHNYQKVADFEVVIDGKNSLITKNLYDIPVKARLKVIKIDAETKEVIQKAGIKFKLKDLKTNKYICETKDCYFETNENGEFTTKTYLFGDYELEEVNQKISGYMWNNRKIKITIDSNTNYDDGNLVTVKFSNQRVKGKVTIKKFGEKLEFANNSFHYEKIPLEGVQYALYADMDIYLGKTLKYKKGELIKTFKTDKNGLIEINDLELGKYYLEETKSVLGHILDKTKHYFELTYKDQNTELVTQTLTFFNYLPKGSLEFLKIDAKTGEYLPDTLIEVYRKAEKEILIYQGTTDEMGKITINDLAFGEYFIKEVKSRDGYYLSEEIIPFEIKENKEVIPIEMKNNPIEEIPVPKTDLNEPMIYKLLSIALLIIGIPTLLYARKKIMLMH